MLVSTKIDELKVVLLAGGQGTRIREETENRPKPMIELGGFPILWHMMSNFNYFGIKKFIICAGYKSEVIVDYFSNFNLRNSDFKIDFSTGETTIYPKNKSVDWEVTVVHTGDSNIGTGGRIFRTKDYLEGKTFICTYGDGLSDIDIKNLVTSHELSGKAATVSVTNPTNRYGVIELDGNSVRTFKEKPKVDSWINSGFFVFNKDIWDYLDDTCTLENEPLQKLTNAKQLNAYKHHGFWQGIDTYRDFELIQNLWNKDLAPWKNWD